MKPDPIWLRRYLITEKDLNRVELFFRDDLLQKQKVDLSLFFAMVREIPLELRSEFQFLVSDDHVICIFGSGINGTEQLAIWAMDMNAYWQHGYDPFHCMRSYPIPANSPFELTLPEQMIPPPRRSVQKVRELFKNGDGAFFLGAAQAMVDSSRIQIRRSQPDAKILENLWEFLPYSAREVLNFCSYWNRLYSEGAQLLVVPERFKAPERGRLSEDQCRDYPESSFEQQLQYALDYEDQELFDKLMARRSSGTTLKLAIFLVVAALILLVVSKILMLLK
jgi:hypothetical protein